MQGRRDAQPRLVRLVPQPALQPLTFPSAPSHLAYMLRPFALKHQMCFISKFLWER